MTSTGLVFDQLYKSKEFTLWATYHEWQSQVHEGFRLACLFEGHFFSWDSWELRKDVHPVYRKYAPKVSEVDRQARDTVMDHLTKHVNFDKLMQRALVAQKHWNYVEGADEPHVVLDQILDKERNQMKKIRTKY